MLAYGAKKGLCKTNGEIKKDIFFNGSRDKYIVG